MKNVVGKRLSEARTKATPPISQKDLVARLESNGWNISRETLAKIETGIRRVRDYELVALAKALNVSPDALLDENLAKNCLRNEKET